MTETHSQRAHTRVSPSGAKRLIECPGSLRLSDGFEDKSSPFANEGTAAHELAQLCLESGFEPSHFKGKNIDIDAQPVVSAKPSDNDRVWPVNDDMVSAVNVYVEHVRWFHQNGYEVSIEERVDLGHIVDGMAGTVDCDAYSDEHKHLFVIEYKHGRGVAVEPQQNPQLALYALGALHRMSNRPVEKVTLTVVQPRASHPRGSVRSWETTPEWLESFAGEFKEKVALANSDDAPLRPGEWCTFCKAAGVCPALREHAMQSAREEFADTTAAASPDEMAEWLQKVEAVEIWCKKVREFTHAQARAGNMPSGFKWVEKRATRKWHDEKQAVAAIRVLAEVSDEDIFTAPALKSVAQIEKVVGKGNFRVLDPFVQKQSSGLVLAPDSDPRPAAKFDATEEFEPVDLGE